ncbi:MAG TPA: beta-propeller fold lactonase family protein [Acidobacteriaceae bacterium]|jgi:6-phosphogluconolactonase (cycloisomerase 2 family)|nr:beta-propeller fold lactonase family protein [Acidobacteriaceae bacterium]
MVFRTLSPGRWLAVGCAALLGLTGCSQFFPPLGSSGGGGSTTSGDSLYVANLGTNPLSVAGFSVATTGALSGISGSPWAVELEPTALAVTPNDSYLYVGSAAGGIYVYTIASSGAITIANNGSPVATGVAPSVLRVDPTGNYLIGADALVGNVYVFQIGSGGALTAISSSLVTLNASLPANDLEITPGGGLVFVSCGTAGIYTLTFNTSTGALAQVKGVLSPKQNSDAIYGMAVTPSGSFLLAAETGIGAVRVFTIGSGGSLTEVTGSPVKTGTGPFGVLVDSTGSYVYVTNRTAGNISAFLLSNSGALTAVTGSPFATGTLPELLVEDKTDTYVAVICAGGGPDLQLFKMDATTAGALDSVATAATGTDPTQASALAATH